LIGNIVFGCMVVVVELIALGGCFNFLLVGGCLHLVSSFPRVSWLVGLWPWCMGLFVGVIFSRS